MLQNKVDIVLTADVNYVKQLCVTICSILENAKKKSCFCFHVFYQNFNEEDFFRLKHIENEYNCHMIYYNMEQYIHYFDKADINTFVNKYINISCYFRLLLFKILPETVNKVFYIDCDIIVETDLLKLQNYYNQYKIIAVMESLAMHHHTTILEHLQRLDEFFRFNKNPYSRPYFNAGFFFVNLKWARKNHIWERVMEIFEKYPNLPYADQDILNCVLGQEYGKNICFLGPEYNVFTDLAIKYDDLYNSKYKSRQIQKAYRKPKIIHYAGINKPWLRKECHFYDNWWKYSNIEDEIQK